MKGAQEWDALATALIDTTPACAGDDRFITDREEVSISAIDAMRATCDTCPLQTLCDAYAAAAKPTGGFWAGDYGTRRKTRKDTTNAS